MPYDLSNGQCPDRPDDQPFETPWDEDAVAEAYAVAEANDTSFELLHTLKTLPRDTYGNPYLEQWLQWAEEVFPRLKAINNALHQEMVNMNESGLYND